MTGIGRNKALLIGAMCLVLTAPVAFASSSKTTPNRTPQSNTYTNPTHTTPASMRPSGLPRALKFAPLSHGSLITLEKATTKFPKGLTVYRTLDRRGKVIATFLVGPKAQVMPLSSLSWRKEKTGAQSSPPASTSAAAVPCPCSTNQTHVSGTPLIVVIATGSGGRVIRPFVYNSHTGKVTML